MGKFRIENSISNVNRVSTTFQMEKKDWIKLNNIKLLILEEFDIRLPNTFFLNNAFSDFLLFNFNQKEDLKKACEIYLEEKELI